MSGDDPKDKPRDLAALKQRVLEQLPLDPSAEPAPKPESTNARYQQLKTQGGRLVSARRRRSLSQQRTLARLEQIGIDLNSHPPLPSEIAYLTPFLIRATLPHKKPKAEIRTWRRRYHTHEGIVTVTYEAGVADTADGKGRPIGLPYGVYARLILSWIVTEALTTGSPVLRIEPNLTSWIRDALDLIPSGGDTGTFTGVRDAMTRLLNCKIKLRLNGKDAHFTVVPIEGATNFWDKALAADDDAALTAEEIRELDQNPLQLTVNGTFFQQILERSAPFLLRAHRELANTSNCLALDLYPFLTLKQYSLYIAKAKAPEIVSWDTLSEFLGHTYKRRDHFQEGVIAALEMVKKIYPGCNAEVVRGGILVRPGEPHVPLKDKSPKTALAAASKPTAALPAPDAAPRPVRGS